MKTTHDLKHTEPKAPEPTPLDSDAAVATGLNRKLVLKFSDLHKPLPGLEVPANTLVGRWLASVVTPFASSGGSIEQCVLHIGDDESPCRFINRLDLLKAGVSLGEQAVFLFTSADTIDVRLEIAGRQPESLNSGEVAIFYWEGDLGSLLKSHPNSDESKSEHKKYQYK